MAQFRKSKKVGPFRLTLSQRGLSTSVGAGPIRISRGADGKTRRTVRIPGTGIYDTKVISKRPAAQKKNPTPTSPQHPSRTVTPTGTTNITKPSTGMIVAACVFTVPILLCLIHGFWVLGVGLAIGVFLACRQDIKTRQQALTAAPTQHLPTATPDIDALKAGFYDPDYGQAARIMAGAELLAAGRDAEALDCFNTVLAEPPSATATEFLTQNPVPVTFQALGMNPQLVLSRSTAAIYAATIYQSRDDSQNAWNALQQADESELVETLKAIYAFNLENFDDVLHITRWMPMPAETPFNAFAIIMRGCALREKGQTAAALETLNAAAAIAADIPEISIRLTFEIGRTLARQGDYALARRKYIQVHQTDPHFPGLEQALAALDEPHPPVV